eukprot:COSAG02_NODE_12174_length_1585_cov_1.273217_1_plen_442_part_10
MLSRGSLELLFLYLFVHEVYSEDVIRHEDGDTPGPCWYDQSTGSIRTCTSDEPQDSRFCTVRGFPPEATRSDAEWAERGGLGSSRRGECFDKVSCGCLASTMCWYDQSTGNIRTCTGDETVDYYVCRNADRLTQRCFDKASCGCSDGLLYADVDCAGTWSNCTGECRRTWIQSAAQSGQGQACPIGMPRCRCGEDECPPPADFGVETRCYPGPPSAGGDDGRCPVEQLPTATPLQPLTVPCWYDQSTEAIRTCAFDENVGTLSIVHELCTNGSGLAQRCQSVDRASCMAAAKELFPDGCRDSSYRQPCWVEWSTGSIRTCAFDELWDFELCTNGDILGTQFHGNYGEIFQQFDCFDKASCKCPEERRRAQESTAAPAAPPPASPPPASPSPASPRPSPAPCSRACRACRQARPRASPRARAFRPGMSQVIDRSIVGRSYYST